MDQRNFSSHYDTLLDLVKARASVRKLKPDAIPDECVTQVLEVGRWAMSGDNGQPWDFIVVKDVIRHSLKELGILATVPEAKAIYNGTFVPVKF
jgi:nitroreductase